MAVPAQGQNWLGGCGSARRWEGGIKAQGEGKLCRLPPAHPPTSRALWPRAPPPATIRALWNSRTMRRDRNSAKLIARTTSGGGPGVSQREAAIDDRDAL